MTRRDAILELHCYFDRACRIGCRAGESALEAAGGSVAGAGRHNCRRTARKCLEIHLPPY
jgi:hypothetical protein